MSKCLELTELVLELGWTLGMLQWANCLRSFLGLPENVILNML